MLIQKYECSKLSFRQSVKDLEPVFCIGFEPVEPNLDPQIGSDVTQHQCHGAEII